MADQPSGSGGEKERKKLSLQQVLEAVLDSSEDTSDDECFGDSSLDESSEDEDPIPIKFISDEPCSRDSLLLLDVSCHFLPLFSQDKDDEVCNN